MKTAIFAAGLILLLTIPASAFVCGDANGDQAINIGDPVYLINYIFKEGPAPEPLLAGDANADQDVNIGDAVFLIDHIFKGGPPPCPAPTGGVIAHSGCLSYDKNPDDSTYLDCIDYEYDGVGTLALTHRNAIFNCCPTYLLAYISVADNVITITEDEDLEPYGGCDCVCLFDVDMMIVGLPPGVYTVYVDELYIGVGEWDPREDIQFIVDLTSATSGSY
jgi:hypothetical protein